MIRILNKITRISVLLLVCAYPIVGLSATTASQIQQLEHLLQMQQKQLAQQQKQINAMEVKLEKISNKKHLPPPTATAPTHPERQPQIKKHPRSLQGYKKSRILISGTINELAMYGADGYSPAFYYGPNDYYNTRLNVTLLLAVTF